jgi:hypothetical protein
MAPDNMKGRWKEELELGPPSESSRNRLDLLLLHQDIAFVE